MKYFIKCGDFIIDVAVRILQGMEEQTHQVRDVLLRNYFINGLFGRREEDEREIWTREVAEKGFISSVWSRREIETTD